MGRERRANEEADTSWMDLSLKHASALVRYQGAPAEMARTRGTKNTDVEDYRKELEKIPVRHWSLLMFVVEAELAAPLQDQHSEPREG